MLSDMALMSDNFDSFSCLIFSLSLGMYSLLSSLIANRRINFPRVRFSVYKSASVSLNIWVKFSASDSKPTAEGSVAETLIMLLVSICRLLWMLCKSSLVVEMKRLSWDAAQKAPKKSILLVLKTLIVSLKIKAIRLTGSFGKLSSRSYLKYRNLIPLVPRVFCNLSMTSLIFSYFCLLCARQTSSRVLSTKYTSMKYSLNFFLRRRLMLQIMMFCTSRGYFPISSPTCFRTKSCCRNTTLSEVELVWSSWLPLKSRLLHSRQKKTSSSGASFRRNSRKVIISLSFSILGLKRVTRKFFLLNSVSIRGLLCWRILFVSLLTSNFSNQPNTKSVNLAQHSMGSTVY